MTRIRLLLDDNTIIEIKSSNEDQAWTYYNKLRIYYEERNIKFKVFVRRFLHWKRLYTINDITFG